MKTNRLIAVFLMLLSFLLSAGCGDSSEETLRFGSSEPLKLSDVDYADPNNWLRFGGNMDVDIFAVYPTVSFSEDEADLPYMRLDSPVMRESAAAWLERVDGVITPAGNVYAPLYGQLNSAMLANLDNAGFESYTYANPRDDVFAAFDYFLTQINKGERPFILFGHSQGAALVSELATRFLGNERYYRYNTNHIATYAVGFSVTQAGIDRNPNLTFSQSRDDTGVILSWNTTAPSEIASKAYRSFGTWNAGALVTNPIRWQTLETLAHAADNPGSIANAIVDMEHRVLVTTTVPEADYSSAVPTISIFHQHDIDLYHDSIAQNLKDRIAAFRQR